jgi:nucleoid DNA-binding protein
MALVPNRHSVNHALVVQGSITKGTRASPSSPKHPTRFCLAEIALQETRKNGEFTIPGLGKLVQAQRAARIRRNPQTGESIKIKAKTTVKFRVAKAAKDAIASVK